MRFPEFSGEWTKRKIKNIFENVTRGYVLSKKDISTIKTNIFKYPVYSSQTLNNGLLGYYSNYLYENAITWTTDGANAGEVNFRRDKFYCTNVCGVLLSNNGYCNDCMAAIINKITKKFVSFVGNPKLMNNVMENIEIIFPSNIKEQLKVASFLSLIDKRIELQNKIIKDYELLKKETKNRIFAKLLSCEKRHFLEIFTPFIELNNNDYPQYTIGKQGLLPLPIESQKYNKKHHIVFKENTCIFGIGINEVGVSIDTIGCCSPIYKVYSINGKIIDTYFLQQFINKYLMLNINKITKKSTRREFEIDNSELLKISFNIPNLLVQKRISNIFNKISIYLKLNLEILENLQCLKKYLLTKMFI